MLWKISRSNRWLSISDIVPLVCLASLALLRIFTSQVPVIKVNRSLFKKRRLVLENLEDRKVNASLYQTSLSDGINWNDPTTLRGVSTVPDAIVADYASPSRTLKAWKTNVVRVQLVNDPVGAVDTQNPAVFSSQRVEYRAWLDRELAKVDSVLPKLQRDGIGVILDMHDPFGGPRWGDESATPHQIFQSKQVADVLKDDWKYIAKRYSSRGNSMNGVIIGFELMNEPSVLRSSNAGNPTAAEAIAWSTLAKDLSRIVRDTGGLNRDRTMIIDSIQGNPHNLKYLEPSEFRGPTVFSFHLYDPRDFAEYSLRQKRGLEVNAQHELFSNRAKEHVDSILNWVKQWQTKNKVRIYVGEFSASAYSDSSLQRKRAVASYLRYVTDRFEENGWDHTYHAFRESATWDLEQSFGNDRDLWGRSRLKFRWASNFMIVKRQPS